MNSQMLEMGKERLESATLVKGEWRTDKGYCVMGAVLGPLCQVLPSREIEAMPSLMVMADVIREQFPDRMPPRILQSIPVFDIIVNFNDHNDTTKEDVIIVLEKAIVKAQELV